MFASCDNCNLKVHFVGIGGIGMSGIAEILHSLGYLVQGSDKVDSQNVKRLEKLGIKTFIGHEAKNVDGASVIVYSSAIKSDNPELLRAKELFIPRLSRAEMLSQVVRFKKSVVVAGSHGKTTVTSLCAAVLEMAGLDPTVINGGIINSYSTNAKLGTGDWAVIESDESDGSFLHFFPTIGVITNIDNEHLTYHGTLDNLKNAFKIFLNNLPFYGVGIVCIDDENTADVVGNSTDRRIITYSIENHSMFKAENIRQTDSGTTFDVWYGGRKVDDIFIPLFGKHNVKNALAAIAMSNEFKINIETIKSTLATFSGVNRRFTTIGTIGATLAVDDYAHHPTEISALLDAAHQRVAGKVLLIFQPHRFTRLNLLFEDFCKCFGTADKIIILPVYKADDSESGKVTSKDLFEQLKLQNKDVLIASDEVELELILKSTLANQAFTSDDIILFAGAGNISKWGHDIVAKIGNHV
ncbi:MAG: UDP-N-acetylmuramate--L-alanine ligase [Holosporales bacterium]|jgi:UDP-N-acetylmuramate--alanine ligase|nr:UDP-N-acetylmuramate--L-alanine ligase [Holosporales bacterium]